MPIKSGKAPERILESKGAEEGLGRACCELNVLPPDRPCGVQSSAVSNTKSKPPKASDAVDIAARYLLYMPLDASRGSLTGSWQSVRDLDEPSATVNRAVERGWVVIREDDRHGRAKKLLAALTEEGRAVARKGLR
jgi:hypothetical protein